MVLMLLRNKNGVLRRWMVTGCLCALLIGTQLARADDVSSQQDPLAGCTPYRSKRADVPVYRKPDRTSAVLGKLALGETVCYVGEQDEFAIIDWQRQESLREVQSAELKTELAFIVLTDLWPPPERNTDLGDRIKKLFKSVGSGGLPQDIFSPLSGLFGPEWSEPECLAGEICQKVEEIQNKSEIEDK
jgi:hypothetical protein